MYGIGFEEDEPKATQFKIGQRVRVVKEGYLNGGSYHGAEIGSISTIEAGPDETGMYYDSKWCFCPHEIAPIFTRGDSVRLTRDYGSYKKGHQGTVTIDNDENVGVLMDIGRYAAFPHDVLETFERGSVSDNPPAQPGTPMSPVQPASPDAPKPWSGKPTPHIVAVVDNGRPSPAHRPHVHTGEAAAVTEAERLARANPGKQFDVWRRVTGRVAEQHVELKEVA